MTTARARAQAGPVDSSYYVNPSGGRRYHVDRGDGTPACGAADFIVSACFADNVPAAIRCRRPGCAKRWPKKDPDSA